MVASQENAPLVLLVEDYEANVLVATLYLEYLNYRYEVARSGEEAIDMARRGIYDAILMDVKMSGINGGEATRLIRAFEVMTPCGTRPVPIIGMTAHALVGDREKYLALGMNDYITKPIDENVLKGKLEFYTMAQI